MKLLLLNTMLTPICFLASCQSKPCYLSISSKDTGWIYVVKSKALASGNMFTADRNRVIYVPASFFEKDFFATVKIDGKLPKAGEGDMTTYRVEFYPEHGPKITYAKFYFPLGKESEKKLTHTTIDVWKNLNTTMKAT